MGVFGSLFCVIHGVLGINLIIFLPKVTHFAICDGRLSAYSSTFQHIRMNIQLCVIRDFIVSFYGVSRKSAWPDRITRVRNGPRSAETEIHRVFRG